MMNSPDQPAQTSVAGSANTLQTSQPRRCSWIFPVMTMFFSVSLGMMGSFAVSAFEKVFNDFGAELSAGTLMLIAGKHYFWLMTGVTLLASCAWLTLPLWDDVSDREVSRSAARFTWLFVYICLFDIAAFTVMVYFLYQPIFKIGRVV